MAVYNTDAATVRHFFRWPRTGPKRSGFKVFHEVSAPYDFAGSTAPPASFSDALRITGIRRPDRRAVKFHGSGEIVKPPPIGHFVRFLLRALCSRPRGYNQPSLWM